MQEITKSIISKLAQEKLSSQSSVEVSRDWLLKEGKAYIQVLQNKEFKFHIPCEATDESLSSTEELVVEVIESLGFKVNRKFMN